MSRYSASVRAAQPRPRSVLRGASSTVGLAMLVLVGLLAACRSANSPDGGPTPFPTERPTPTDAAAIRALDLTRVAPVTDFIRQLGGGDVDTPAVLYSDLTSDSREEAIVPITSGGTLGNLGYVILTLRSGSPAALLTLTRERSSPGGVSAAVEDGKLVKYIGKYGPEDPRCCPSALVRTVYYWDGSRLQVEREDEIKQPSPKQ